MSLPKGFPPLDQLNTTGGQKRFNGWLQSRAYCIGFVPTALDKTVYETVGIFTDKSLSNLYRWSNHIASFSPDQRAAWGGEAPAAAPAAPAAAKKSKKKAKKEESDDDLDDLFGDDDDEEEDDFDTMLAKKIAADKDLQARMKMKAEKNAKKGPQKTMFIFDIKPFDTETDLQALAAELKGTEKDGICSWGEEHKLVEIAFGVKKLRIQMIVEDEKLCQDDLEDHINADGRDDKIQSVDVFTMSKL